MQYQVRTLSPNNEIGTLLIEAHNEQHVRQQVQVLGLQIASIEEHKPWIGQTRRSTLPKNFVLLFSQELLALLKAGLSIVESLEALLEKENHQATHNTLARLLQDLREGKRFSRALSEQGTVFSSLYIGIVQAAEGTSDLPRSLERFIDYQQRLDQVRNKVISAAIYPLILLAVGSLVTFFLVGYVVPRFAEVYQGSGRELPWLSQWILDWGKFSQAHSGMVLIGCLTLLLVLSGLTRHFHRVGALGKILDSIPGIGERRHIYELSRLYLTLGMLLEGGIPITHALQTVAAILKPEMRIKLALAKSSIESGEAFSQAFQTHDLVTPVSLRMLRVGERSGELGLMLSQSAAFYDEEIQRWIDRFTRSFEPILMAVIGIIVGTIVVLLYMPIFDLAGNLS
jgi:general secretion pathway protein F